MLKVPTKMCKHPNQKASYMHCSKSELQLCELDTDWSDKIIPCCSLVAPYALSCCVGLVWYKAGYILGLAFLL